MLKTTTKNRPHVTTFVATGAKLGRFNVYLEKSEGDLRLGNKPSAPPEDFFRVLPKGDRRRVRKAMTRNGFRTVVLQGL